MRKHGALKSGMVAALERGPKSTREIGEALGIPRHNANSLMRRALDSGLVRVCGTKIGKRGGRYCSVYTFA